MTRRKPAPAADHQAEPLRDPGPNERKAIEAAGKSLAKRPARVAIKQAASSPGTLAIGPNHADHHGWQDQVLDTFGTRSNAFANASLARIATAIKTAGNPAPTEEETNAALAVMGAVAPADELEAIMGEQIIAAHAASLDFLNRSRLNAGQNFEVANAYAGMATKLSRTMAATVEALAKLRSGGKQQVVVKHVYVQGNAYVGDGGKAVFGPPPWGRGDVTFTSQPDALSPEVWSEDPRRPALQIPCDQGEAPVSDAWGQEPWSAAGQGERQLSERALDPGARGSPPPASRHSVNGG